MRIQESKIALGILLISVASIAVAQTQTPYRKIDQQPQHRVISNPPSTIRVEKAEALTKNPPQLGDSPGVPRVPDVVGLSGYDARATLYRAGFQFKEIDETQPDPSVLYGHVRATVPIAGSLAPDRKVELLFPRAASRLGTGALALSDIERRDGFDLDEGQYQEVLRGADIVLRVHEDEPHAGTNGASTSYSGGGLYIEPSDGAVLATLFDTIIEYSSSPVLGAASAYLECEGSLNQEHVPGVEIRARGALFCVRTSLGEVALVQFRPSDNPQHYLGDYKFHYAIFPLQMVAPKRPSHISGRVHN